MDFVKIFDKKWIFLKKLTFRIFAFLIQHEFEFCPLHETCSDRQNFNLDTRWLQCNNIEFYPRQFVLHVRHQSIIRIEILSKTTKLVHEFRGKNHQMNLPSRIEWFRNSSLYFTKCTCNSAWTYIRNRISDFSSRTTTMLNFWKFPCRMMTIESSHYR